MLMPTMASKKQLLFGGFVVVFAAVTLFVVLPQLSTFDRALDSLQGAELRFVALAIICGLLPCLFGSLLYGLLALKRLRTSSTLLVQLSGLLVNRVLPAGIGGLGLNVWYLRAKRHTLTESSVIVGLNNTLGVIGNVILIVAALALFSSEQIHYKIPNVTFTGVFVALSVSAFAVILAYVYRARLKNVFRQVVQAMQGIRRRFVRHPWSLVVAFGLSCSLTLANAAAFWLVCLAVGVDVSFSAAFLILSAGVLIGTAVPTPGGLGGVEAALVAGLVSQSTDASMALAAALLYRLVTYWLGLVLGGFAVIALRRRAITHML